MLVTLNVKNFAIIDNITIDFNSQMTVITGETGAGKSLIIDAIGLLFGNRASNDLIRFGESKATIEGVFNDINADICKILDNLGIEYDLNDFLYLKRELYDSGKSVCRINNQNVSLNQLKEVSELIGDIHSQMDSFGLINPKNYLNFLKNNEIDKNIISYTQFVKEYRDAKKRYDTLLNKNSDDTQRKDFLLYQLKELKQANIMESEEEQLKEESQFLANYEHIMTSIQNFRHLYEDEKILANIYESLSIIDKLNVYNNEYAKFKSTIEDSYYNLETIINDSLFKKVNLNFDQDRLNDINERLGVYADLKRKYKRSTHELIKYSEDIEKELDDIDNYDVNLEDLKKEVIESYKKVAKIAKSIREKRMAIAEELTIGMKNQLSDLQLKNTNFSISFNEIQDDNLNFFNDGIDIVDFLVSFNKGEPLKPLSKVASGGELSRFMLALKTILGDKIDLQVKIFDEIDSGVSGSIAHSIATKILKIAINAQVLCITHLPQVAATGQNHLRISKQVINNRTTTNIEFLTNKERMVEIASMISNGKPTDASLKLAEELLKDAIAKI